MLKRLETTFERMPVRQGYDAIYIAKKLGLEAVGLDLSETALDAART